VVGSAWEAGRLSINFLKSGTDSWYPANGGCLVFWRAMLVTVEVVQGKPFGLYVLPRDIEPSKDCFSDPIVGNDYYGLLSCFFRPQGMHHTTWDICLVEDVAYNKFLVSDVMIPSEHIDSAEVAE